MLISLDLKRHNLRSNKSNSHFASKNFQFGTSKKAAKIFFQILIILLSSAFVAARLFTNSQFQQALI